MFGYVLRRLFIMIPTLLVISFLVFAIIQAPPGDYLSSYLSELQSQGEAVNPQKIEYLRKQYGLDRPFYEQYFIWVTNLLQGDMGYSFEFSLPVSKVVGDRLALTAVVSVATVLFVWLVSFPIGIYSATHQYSLGDYGLSIVGFIGMATPSFRLPVVVIGASGTASQIRRLRANLLDELQKQYVVTARAKGLPRGRLLVKYPLRLSLNPFIADIGTLLPEMVSGAVIVSVVLSLPTTGPMLLDALRSQDMFLAGSF